MWMQILVSAGFPFIGEKFPESWGDLLNAANPDGFFESELLGGIYYRTNPHPVSGAFLFPKQTRSHAVKVFIPGLVRSDLAYIDRVIATVREWRQFAASVARLRSIVGTATGRTQEDMPELPPALHWWAQNFALVRDLATRCYPVHVTSYARLLEDPEREIQAVLGWIGAGDTRKACEAVRAELQTQGKDASTPEGIDPRHAQIFDDLYGAIHEGCPLTQAFIDQLNRTDRELRAQLLDYEAQAKVEAARAVLSTGDDA